MELEIHPESYHVYEEWPVVRHELGKGKVIAVRLFCSDPKDDISSYSSHNSTSPEVYLGAQIPKSLRKLL